MTVRERETIPIYVYPPSGLLTNVIYSGPSNSLSGYWRVRLLSVELRLFRRLSLRLLSLHSFLFDPVFRLLLASGFFSQLFARLSSGIGVDILFLRLCPVTANMSMYSGAPPYGHIGNTVTSLPLFFGCPQNNHTFCYKKTTLIRPTVTFLNSKQ